MQCELTGEEGRFEEDGKTDLDEEVDSKKKLDERKKKLQTQLRDIEKFTDMEQNLVDESCKRTLGNAMETWSECSTPSSLAWCQTACSLACVGLHFSMIAVFTGYSFLTSSTVPLTAVLWR